MPLALLSRVCFFEKCNTCCKHLIHFLMTTLYYQMGVRKTGSINRDSGIEIPEAWMPTIKKHNNKRAVRQRTAKWANHWVKQEGSKCTNQSCWKTTNHSRASCFIRSRMTSRPHRLKKTMQSKRRDLHHTWLHRETNKKLSFYCYSPQWITTAFF